MTGHNSPGETLAGKFLRGAVWLFGSYALSKLARVVMMLILAGLLSPREYGIISLCATILVFMQVINEFGIWQAVVYRSNLDERFLNTAFTVNVLGGILTTAGIFLIAPWAAYFYGEPEMTILLRVVGLAFILDTIFYVPDGLLRKELRFKSRALPEIAGTFGAVVVTIALLLSGVGVLSYAVGLVAESAIRCILTVRRISWRPKLQVSWLYLREIAAYAKYVLGEGLGKTVANNMDYLIVGRVLGAGPLGFYALAFNLGNYPINNFAQILSRIAFPAFASLQEEPDYAKHVYLKLIRIVAALVVPALAILALLAGPLVVGLLGEKWQPAVFPLQIMVIAGISRAISIPGSDMLRAFGAPSVPFKISILQGFAISGALVLVASRGIDTVAVTVAIILSLTSWLITVVTCRTFGIGPWELSRTLMPAMALMLSGVGAVFSLNLLGPSFSSDTLELAVLIGAAGAAMVLCLMTVCRSFFHELLAFLPLGKPR